MNLDIVTQYVHQPVREFVHAYRVAPWRIQRQWLGNALLAVAFFAMVAALYLDVTSRAAIAGREIQDLTFQTNAVEHTNADLQTQLAALTSASVMEQRAIALGYAPMETGAMEYLIVPGYTHSQPLILSAAPQPVAAAPGITPEFKQSLLDWLDQKVQAIGETQ